MDDPVELLDLERLGRQRLRRSDGVHVGLFATECICTTVFHARPYRTIGGGEYANGWGGNWGSQSIGS